MTLGNMRSLGVRSLTVPCKLRARQFIANTELRSLKSAAPILPIIR
jgi:hypothetical protein